MPTLDIAPTKSNLLALRRQLSFAEEGYDLLEEKRQILIYELMSRLSRARDAERRVAESLGRAFAALQEAALDAGVEALDRAALGVVMDHRMTLSDQHVMGLRIPHAAVACAPARAQVAFAGTSGNADLTTQRFTETLPLLAELAELANAIQRLARELRKTQRRCNALSKTIIPNQRETIHFIVGTLEERERESVVILKMIRQRLDAR